MIIKLLDANGEPRAFEADASGNLKVVVEAGGSSIGSVTPGPVIDMGDQYFDSAALATAVSLTVPTGAKTAIIQCEGTASVRWRNKAQTPTSTVGMKLGVDQAIYYTGELDKIRIIRVADGAALNVQYFG